MITVRVLVLWSFLVSVTLASFSQTSSSTNPSSYSSSSSKKSVNDFTALSYDQLERVMNGLEASIVDLEHSFDVQSTPNRFPCLRRLQQKIKKHQESNSIVEKVTESLHNAFQVALLIIDDALLVGAPVEKTVMPVDREMSLMPVDSFDSNFDGDFQVHKLLASPNQAMSQMEQAKLHAWLNCLLQRGDQGRLSQLRPFKATILPDLSDKMAQIASGFTSYCEFVNLAQKVVQKTETKITEHPELKTHLQHLIQTMKLFKRQLVLVEHKLNKQLQLYNSLGKIKQEIQ